MQLNFLLHFFKGNFLRESSNLWILWKILVDRKRAKIQAYKNDEVFLSYNLNFRAKIWHSWEKCDLFVCISLFILTIFARKFKFLEVLKSCLVESAWKLKD